MRTKSDIRFVVDADPAQVLDAFAAVELLPNWSPAHRDARVATRDQDGRPRRVFVTTDLTGGSDMQVLEYEWTGTRVSWEIVDSSRGVKGSGFLEVAGGPDSTDVRYRVELYLPIPVPGFMLGRTQKRANETAVENFIEFAERFPEIESYEAV